MAVAEAEMLGVVGGIGFVTSIGIGEKEFGDNLFAGRSGIEVVEFPETRHSSKVKVGGRVKNFGEDEWTELFVKGRLIDPSDFKYYHRTSYGALEAARQAFAPFTKFVEEDGKVVPRLDPEIFDRRRIGVIVASEGGGTVDEALRTHERVTRQDERAVKMGLRQGITERIMEAANSGLILNSDGTISQEIAALVEELTAFSYRVANDRNDFRQKLQAENEAIIRGLVDTPLGVISRAWGLNFRSRGTYSACASGEDAVADAEDTFANPQNKVDGLLVVGAEFSLNYIVRAQFERIKALSTIHDPNRTPRPFDINGDGFVISEGAGAIFLVKKSFAEQHNLQVRAWHLGSGGFDEAYSMTSPLPDGEGTYQAFEALKERRVEGITIEEMMRAEKYIIKGHGTGTNRPGDGNEALGISRATEDTKENFEAFGSQKGQKGHELSATAVIEIGGTILGLERGEMWPNTNCDEIMEEAEGLPLAREARPIEAQVGLTSSNGFGGHQRFSGWKVPR